ncbi:hypothetical protein [Flexivirga oryzae]|uniref:Putative nuclease of restriction endonuclease-like (RecB) superfamily n=1 Tax=Flexivirga oryzae TaxID=1794944 RepID=A0A839N4T5_9MICO|nr:hypothetical protein [Flexivirga oryzae]MBB2890646.1 putative nuclease of restriction endonuclease-like (RecB) superfamily [Flexivirga oryzae]
MRTHKVRSFYIEQAIAGRLSAKALRQLIGRQGFERKEVANAQPSSRAELQTRIQTIYRAAAERMARRELPSAHDV